MLNLIRLTTSISNGNPAEQSSAFEEILKLAEQGNSEAMFQASRCFRHGRGVKINEDQGDYWLRRACVVRPVSTHALFVLGMQHFLGQRQESNPFQGWAMITQAAAGGLPIAVVKMAEVYEQGCAIFGPDLSKAYRSLAGAFGEKTDAIVMSAYEKFVARHAPLTFLLDS